MARYAFEFKCTNLECLLSGSEQFVFDSVETAVAAFKRGELVVVMDDESRENEGDLLMAAEFATPEQVRRV